MPAKSIPSASFSTFLDLVRFMAALVVFLEHAKLSHLLPSLPWTSAMTSAAVASFFVLSGYVITATTRGSDGWRTYAVARLARLYSVVVPAWVLSIVVKFGYAAFLEMSGAGTGLALIQEDLGWWQPLAIALFLGESWTLHVPLPWNGVIWSLDFEAFYYVLFGILTFVRGRQRVWAFATVALLAGPKILVLGPCWMLGAALATRPDLAFPSRTAARVASVLAPVLVWFVAASGLENYVKYQMMWPYVPGFWRLQDAQNFATYYVDAALVGVWFVAVRQLASQPILLLEHAKTPIRWFAGYTFSLYMFHRPFQKLAEDILDGRTLSFAQGAAVLLLIFLVVVALGSVTEKRKDVWVGLFSRWLHPRRKALAPAG